MMIMMLDNDDDHEVMTTRMIRTMDLKDLDLDMAVCWLEIRHKKRSEVAVACVCASVPVHRRQCKRKKSPKNVASQKKTKRNSAT